MTEQLKKRSIIYGAGVLIYVFGVILTMRYTVSDWTKFFVFLIAYLVIGFDAFQSLRDRLLQKKFLTEYTLIILATVGSFGIGKYVEGVFVMILFELGMMFEAFCTDNAKRSIEQTIDIQPTYATRKLKGKEVQVEPSELKVRNIIIIKPGERIPVDAVVTAGVTTIDTKALTGEAMPQTVEPGDKIYSGCINLSGVIEARVTKVYEDSTVSRIMKMVEEAQAEKAESETFVNRFSKIYTPLMLILALIVMLYPPLSFSYGNWNTWIYRGLIFLILACPTGLALSIPITFLGGLASAARHGILIKGRNYLEDLAKADIFIFDKTGTLTEGVFRVQEIHPIHSTSEKVLKVAAHAEAYSNHPIAQSILEAYDGELDKEKVYRVKETPGYGVSATYEGEKIYIGNHRLMEKQKIEVEEVTSEESVVYVAVGKKCIGYLIIADQIREEAYEVVDFLREKGNAVLVMLTGDSQKAGELVADELDLDYVYANLMPADKLEQMEEFLNIEDDSEKVVCVGDGINDALVLAKADIGIAMGDLGSAAAIEAADIVLMNDDLSKIKDAMRIARETLRVVKQNIVFAMFIKVLVLFMAVIGYFGMWEAILVEVGVVFVSILNAVSVVKYTV